MMGALRLFLLLSLCLAAHIVRGETGMVVHLGTKVQWSPYHVDTPHGADGIAVRALACIMARINQPFQIKKVPWKRAQEETRTGALDGFFSASKNDKRDRYATLSKVFLPQERVFYSIKGKVNVPLKDYTLNYIHKNVLVGARHGSNALNSLKKGQYKIGSTPQTQNQLLTMLELGRFGAVLENSLVFPELVKDSGKSMTDFYPVVQKTKNMGVYFGHLFLAKHPDFLETFNRQVQPCSLLPH